MLKIVAVFVATIMVMQVSAAEHEVEGLEQLQKQFHSFQQQMQEENQKLTEQLSQQIDDMQQHWLAEEQKLKQEINNHKDDINNQNQRIEELQVENNNFQHKAENLFGKFTHGNQNLRHLLDKTTSQRKHNSTVIAFSAYSTAEQDYDVGGIVQFDSIITNEGGLYSGQSSTFTCLIPGYYQFSVNVRATPGHSMQGQIEIAGEVVAAVWADHDYDSASNTVIACCPRNNQVMVKATLAGSSMMGDPSAPLSMFTGFLISAGECLQKNNIK